MTRLSDFVGGRSLAQIYDEGWGPILDPFCRDLQAYVSAGDSVLDVGCGTGKTTLCACEAAGMNGRIVGIDPTDFLLERARSKSSSPAIEWVGVSVEDMKFADGTFDDVLCNQTLQYVADPLVSLKAMARVTKPGGTVAVSVWSPVETQIPTRDLEQVIARFISPEVATLHGFSFGGQARLESLTRQAGLDPVSVETVSHSTTFDSVATYAELVLAGAGHVLPDGSLGMGLFDLEDQKYVEGVEDLIATLEQQWAPDMQDGRLVVRFSTDVVVARKR